MQIQVITSNKINNFQWMNYCKAFNQVFDKNYDTDYFLQKYINTIDTYSYHSLLLENEQIVGACTVIPMEYIIKSEKIRIGLAVDVFIVKEYRTDPFSLHNMYTLLKNKLVEQNIVLVIAVPNDIAYPYWKKIVGWKDIGLLPYFALPIKIGNVISKWESILNPLNVIFSKIVTNIYLFSNFKENILSIRLNRENSIIEKQRYTSQHKRKDLNDSYFSYIIVDESNTKVCYLIDFYNKNSKLKDKKTLQQAMLYILRNETIDIIIFIGKLNFKQRYLFRVPFKFEPKHLYFTGDNIIPNKINNDLVYNIENWDFGLFNYDVR